jgi:hypothetical protein
MGSSHGNTSLSLLYTIYSSLLRSSSTSNFCREVIWNCCVLLYSHSPDSHWNWLHTRYIVSAPTTHRKHVTRLLLLKRVHQSLHSNGRGADNSGQLLLRYPATSSKHLYFYYCLRYNVFTESLSSNALVIHVTIPFSIEAQMVVFIRSEYSFDFLPAWDSE